MSARTDRRPAPEPPSRRLREVSPPRPAEPSAPSGGRPVSFASGPAAPDPEQEQRPRRAQPEPVRRTSGENSPRSGGILAERRREGPPPPPPEPDLITLAAPPPQESVPAPTRPLPPEPREPREPVDSRTFPDPEDDEPVDFLIGPREDADEDAFVIRPRISAKQASELAYGEERPRTLRSRLEKLIAPESDFSPTRF